MDTKGYLSQVIYLDNSVITNMSSFKLIPMDICVAVAG